MKTTLNLIRAHSPCKEGWVKLLANLGKTTADNEPLSIVTIFDSNGLDDALWCLQAVEGYEREIRLYAVWCSRRVQHLMTDARSIDALNISERFANGLATIKELRSAEAAARSAAESARSAAWSAAWSAAAAVESTARLAARLAEGAAVESAESAALAASAASAEESAQEKHLREICNA